MRSKPWVAGLALMALLVAAGCGSDAPSAPTPRSTTTGESINEGSLAGHATACVPFRQGAAGASSASINQQFPIEIGPGSCNGGTAAARGDGEVSGQLPMGDSFVRFQNPTDSAKPYRVVIRYQIAS